MNRRNFLKSLGVGTAAVSTGLAESLIPKFKYESQEVYSLWKKYASIFKWPDMSIEYYMIQELQKTGTGWIYIPGFKLKLFPTSQGSVFVKYDPDHQFP